MTDPRSIEDDDELDDQLTSSIIRNHPLRGHEILSSDAERNLYTAMQGPVEMKMLTDNLYIDTEGLHSVFVDVVSDEYAGDEPSSQLLKLLFTHTNSVRGHLNEGAKKQLKTHIVFQKTSNSMQNASNIF